MTSSNKISKIWYKRTCCVKNCDTIAGMGIPVHRFPKKEDLLWKWIDATRVTCVSFQTIICGLHVKESCYTFRPNIERKTLKRNSIPTLNLPGSSKNYSTDEYSTDGNSSGEETTSLVNEIHSVANENENVSVDDENYCECEHDIDMLDAPTEDSDVHKLERVDSNSNVVIILTNKLNGNGYIFKDIGTQTEETIEERVKNITIDSAVQTDKQATVNSAVQTDEKRFSFLDLLKTDADLKAFTGITFSILDALDKSIREIKNFDSDKRLCSLKERIILVLCKLKLCLSYDCLGVLFNISRSTANNYFSETVHLLSSVLEEAVYFPSKEEIRENIPDHFKEFSKTRTVLDCTEIAVESSRCLRCKLKMYSHYKAKQTLKVMIGTTPSGLISFCSKCHGGRASDKIIFVSSGLLEKLTPYDDAIMTDKGFLIQEDCEKSNVTLIRPPFANQNEQMSEADTVKTNKIAAARVHIDRTIERMKNFSILKSTIDWEMTKYMDEIMIIICGLFNLSAPILGDYHFST